MSVEEEAIESEVVELDEAEEVVDTEEQANEEEQSDESEDGEAGDNQGELVVTIEGEKADEEEAQAESAPEWVRKLRKDHRESQRRIRELESQLKHDQQDQAAPAPGKKPALEEFDYDTEKYESAVDAWHERKRQYDDAVAKKEQAEEEGRKAWQQKLDRYAAAKSDLKAKDFEEIEGVVSDLLDITQQGIVISGAENPALVIYALGKSPAKAKELSSIKDPIQFAFAVAKLETKLKVTGKKAPPPPEKKIAGSAPKSGTVDSTLDRLRAEAEKTGDYSKVAQYRRQNAAK